MKYEDIKQEFIKTYMEYIEFANQTNNLTKKKILTEIEKLDIYRTNKKYNEKVKTLAKVISNYIFKENNKTIIEINLDNDCLESFSDNPHYKDMIENYFYIKDTKKINISKYDINTLKNGKYSLPFYLILNKQSFFDKPIYIFSGFYDSSEDCYGPILGNIEDYIYGIYYDIYNYNRNPKEIQKRNIHEFEKEKRIIYKKNYVYLDEINRLFNLELINENNKSIDDCVRETNKRIEELNYEKSPEHKEEVLLDRINKLYQKVKGKCINKELLYSGEFLDIIKETYKLPNDKTLIKEKIVKNKGKDSVIVIGVTPDKKYLITFQNRIENELIAEFPAGYIEKNETPIDAAKRELEEETGYTSDNLMMLDEVYPMMGIDNSKTYIVIADDCIKKGTIKTDGNELVSYDLFSKNELDYLFYSNFIKGSLNKLAYYNLIRTEVWNYFIENNNRKSIRTYKEDSVTPKQLLIKKYSCYS